MKPRLNLETAKLLDASVNILRSHGLYVAARMLCEAGVPAAISSRVLLHPERRRALDNAVMH